MAAIKIEHSSRRVDGWGVGGVLGALGLRATLQGGGHVQCTLALARKELSQGPVYLSVRLSVMSSNGQHQCMTLLAIEWF